MDFFLEQVLKQATSYRDKVITEMDSYDRIDRYGLSPAHLDGFPAAPCRFLPGGASRRIAQRSRMQAVGSPIRKEHKT
jgi:hypothetical protein